MPDTQDIRALVHRHLESNRSALSDAVYRGILCALMEDDLQRVHDLLVAGAFEVLGQDRARRLLREVDAEITLLEGCSGPLH
jgi:hypothetical protein